GHLNLYLLLDASQSVSEKDFNIFKESAFLMVDRIFSFEIKVSVAIITFASRLSDLSFRTDMMILGREA
ncbi:VWA domain-containing protein, partial [Escherichia coli]|nr:VWA domain-containing protein [Escherichia coli]